MAIWGVAAVVALGYLAHARLAAGAAWPLPPKVAEPEPGLSAAVLALAEVGTVRQAVDTLQKDVGDLKGSVEQRSDHERTLQSRVAAARGAAGNTAEQRDHHRRPPTSRPPSRRGRAQGDRTRRRPRKPRPRPRRQGRRRRRKPSSVPKERQRGATPANDSKTRSRPAASPSREIVFGEAVVTRAEQLYAVQLDYGGLARRAAHALGPAGRAPRLDARHPAAALRCAAARKGGPYRLLAGPLTSAADAKRNLRRAARPAARLQHHRLRRRAAVAVPRRRDASCRADLPPSLRALATRLGDGRRSSCGSRT